MLFVGREREKEVYEKFLTQETPWVLIITGLGGIGKTTLLDWLAAYTFSISRLFKIGVIKLDFAYEELRNDPLKLIDKLTTDTAPYCDLQQIDSKFKNELLESYNQLAQLSLKRAQTGTSDSEDLALREIRHQMRELAIEAFYLQIKTFKLERLVMILDTCEWLSEPEGIEVGQWVLNELIPGLHSRMRQQGQQCSAVIASRILPRLNVINRRDQRHLTLPMLGKAEVHQYLEHMGMDDADLRQRVYGVTHGHALCVSIIGHSWREQLLTIADLPELQVQEFSEKALMEFTNDRVLRQLKGYSYAVSTCHCYAEFSLNCCQSLKRWSGLTSLFVTPTLSRREITAMPFTNCCMRSCPKRCKRKNLKCGRAITSERWTTSQKYCFARRTGIIIYLPTMKSRA